MAQPRAPLLLYLFPLLAVAVLGLSTFLGTGSSQVRSALVLGGPTDRDSPFRGRLQARLESDGFVTPLARMKVRLQAIQGTHVIDRRLETDETGWLEFELPLKKSPPFHLRVRDDDGHVLAEGTPELPTRRWATSAQRRGGGSRVHREGDLTARVHLDRRVLAVPFPGRGNVVVSQGAIPASGANIKLSGRGLEIVRNARGETDDGGRFAFEVRPDEHNASLGVVIEHAGSRLVFDQLLPVVPGAYGYKRNEQGFVVLAPVPRDEAWFTFVKVNERLRGGRILLKEDGGGVFSGMIPGSAVPREPGLFLVLTSSADGRSPSTVGYPLDGQESTFDAWDAYLIDGGPPARRAAEAKQRKVRLMLGGYAAVAGLLTLVLFVYRVRRSDREISERLARAGADAVVSEGSPLPLLIAVVGLFFAFSAGVLWIVAR